MVTLCAGYERGSWRQDDFVKYLFGFLLEFAFRWSALRQLNSATASRMIEEAARRLYDSERFDRRGEFGELLLHAALRNHFGTEPAVAKIFYKSNDNDTVKGFDCVHVSEGDDGELALWLGEAKFYADAVEGIAAALKSLGGLLETERLKRELTIIRGHSDPDWPLTPAFQALTAGRSLDDVFPILRIPVLVTYDSAAVASNTGVTDEYLDQLTAEVAPLFERFASDERLPQDAAIHLILIPLREKRVFAAALHDQLIRYQAR